MSDGREATVVYHGLDGCGIQWGHFTVDESQMDGIDYMTPREDVSDDYPYFPEAMLRRPYPSASVECVGEDFEIVEVKR